VISLEVVAHRSYCNTVEWLSNNYDCRIFKPQQELHVGPVNPRVGSDCVGPDQKIYKYWRVRLGLVVVVVVVVVVAAAAAAAAALY